MSLDHSAIYKAYAGTVISISDESGAVDKDGKSVSLDSSLVAKARTEIDEEYAKVKYKDDRVAAYPSIQDQLDMQYWDKKNGTTTWVDAITKVKTDYPKPPQEEEE